MENELISLIVPVYNTADYLPRCVESLISQSLRELEIILIDDGSSDSSPEICEDFARRDRRIRVFHRENSGLAPSRSFGLEMSRGSYAAFVDSDDYIAPDMLEKMYLRMQEEDSQLCVCRILRVSEEGDISPLPRPLPSGVLSGREAISLLGGDMGHQLVPMCNKLYRRELFNAVPFPGRMCCEDEMLIHRILYNCARVSFIDEVLYFYLRRSGSITDSIDDRYLLDAASAFLDRCVFLSEKGLYAPALTAASGALNLIYRAECSKEQKPRERELSKALKAAAGKIKAPPAPPRMRLKLFLLPGGKFIYLALRRLKAAVTGRKRDK